MDIHNNVKVSRALSPVAAGTDNTAYVSEILDTAGLAAAKNHSEIRGHSMTLKFGVSNDESAARSLQAKRGASVST